MSAGRIVLLVFGILFVLASFGLLIGGGVILAFDNTFKNDQGFYSSGSLPVKSASAAIVSGAAEIHLDNVWFIENRNPITIQVEGTSTQAGKQIFIGVAPESDLNNYLNNVSYDEIVDISFQPYNIDYFNHTGNATPSAPASQNFWVASATGPGTQTLQWNVTSGNYKMVVMNSDGSAPVNASVTLGAKIPDILNKIGLGLLIGGIVLLIIGGIMIFFAARGW